MEQKSETIKMLNFLIKQYETIPEINELHLIQLLLNIIPDLNILYNIKFEQLQQKFNENIEKTNILSTSKPSSAHIYIPNK